MLMSSITLLLVIIVAVDTGRSKIYPVLQHAAAWSFSTNDGWYRNNRAKQNMDIHHRRYMALSRYGPSSVPMEKNHTTTDDVISLSSSSSLSSLSSLSQQNEIFQSNFESRKRALIHLMRQIDNVIDPQHIPSLLTRNIDVLLLLMQEQDHSRLISTIIDEIRIEQGNDATEKMEDIIDLMLSFAEQFVNEAKQIEERNQQLLGRILVAMTGKTLYSNNYNGMKGYDREDSLDHLFAEERNNLTPGFVRHLAMECQRIASAPSFTPLSSRLLETLRVIQARVLEELGKELGQAAIVLNQLVAYDKLSECLAVLDAGLAVQGIRFAHELHDLTTEALEGFSRVPGGADDELVDRITDIRKHLDQRIQNDTNIQSFQ
jgi:hypothetical protein